MTVLWAGQARPAHAAFDWRKILGKQTKRHIFTPRRGPVFDWQALAYTPLEVRELSEETKDGIVTKSVMFHSETDGHKSVDIFAFYSYPVGGKNLPAFIWIEGGLAQAKTYRTHFGAKRGYATLAIDFPQPGYRSTGDYPINLGMQIGENPQQAPIYHGAVALLKAVSFLEAQPEVDKNRIGMAGSSWGGFYTTLMTGVDPRLKAAACLFGCGNLQIGNMWWDAYGRSASVPPELREHWRTTLDPAWRLPHCKTPIAWFTATNDWFFWMPSMMHTYQMAGGPKTLALLPNWDHALPPEVVEQLFVWLDAQLKHKPGLLEVSPLELTYEDDALWASWQYSGPRKARSADVMISWGKPGNWHARCWETRPVRLRNGECRVKLPLSDDPFYIAGNVTDTVGFRSSTPLRYVQAPRAGLHLQPISDEEQNPVLTTNGCAEWHSFEGVQTVFLRRHNWWKHGNLYDSLTRDAFTGRKALVLQQDTILPLLHFTEGYRHRLIFWAKADKPTTIGVRFNAGFCGQPQDIICPALVGTRWTKIACDVTPFEDLHFRYNTTLVIPPGATIKVDEFSFRPLPHNGKVQPKSSLKLIT